MCVWNESIGWQHKVEHLTDERFLGAQQTNIEEMIAGACNRPSVILWGILNESHSHDAACRGAYERLLGRIRQLDPTRPVTYACNHPLDDVCLDLVDVISVNTYPGWYWGTIEEIPAALDKIVARIDGTGHADKPFIISEIGGAAVYGCRDWNADRWTEQYQARLLETVIRTMFVERERYCGLAIWQFCDGRTMPTIPSPMMTRARGFNNKGVVDEYRRPKMGYEVVKQWFRKLNGGTL
jgi:beta-glucuronidase